MRDDFSGLRLPQEFAERFPQDARALFDWICPQITDETLRVIAASDPDEHAERNVAVLQAMRDGDLTLRPTGECLHLFPWRTYSPTARIFCILARGLSRSGENRGWDPVGTLDFLIESSRELGQPAPEKLLRFLSWAMSEAKPWDEDYLFLAFGLVATAGLESDLDAPTFDRLAAWFTNIAEEITSWHRREGQTRYARFEVHEAERWRRLARSLAARHPEAEGFDSFLNVLMPT